MKDRLTGASLGAAGACILGLATTIFFQKVKGAAPAAAAYAGAMVWMVGIPLGVVVGALIGPLVAKARKTPKR
jgi:hypothetical protein